MACDAEARALFAPDFLLPVDHASGARSLLAQGDALVETALHEEMQGAARKLRGRAEEDLVAAVEDASAPLFQRLAAGNLLCLIGDPRIDPLRPCMIDLPGGLISIGTDAQTAKDKFSDYKKLGLRQAWIDKEVPRHIRQIDRIRIAKYPVTNVEYRVFLRDTRLPFIPTAWSFGRFPEHMANHPVHSVLPEHADAYAQWLCERTGRAFRLPSEVEWEYAATGGIECEFPWGDSYDWDRANTGEIRLMSTSSVGAFPRGNSQFGVTDLAGNVEEIVADSYAPYPAASVIEDDLWKQDSNYRITRGGSFTRFRDLARCRRRHGFIARFDVYVFGFRLAEDIQ